MSTLGMTSADSVNPIWGLTSWLILAICVCIIVLCIWIVTITVVKKEVSDKVHTGQTVTSCMYSTDSTNVVTALFNLDDCRLWVNVRIDVTSVVKDEQVIKMTASLESGCLAKASSESPTTDSIFASTFFSASSSSMRISYCLTRSMTEVLHLATKGIALSCSCLHLPNTSLHFVHFSCQSFSRLNAERFSFQICMPSALFPPKKIR